MKIYSRRHPLNAMNTPGWLLKGRWDEAKAALLDSCNRYESMTKSIKTVKPDRAPARMLTDTCDGIHPTFANDYIRRTMPLDKINVQRLLSVIKKSFDAADLEATKL